MTGTHDCIWLCPDQVFDGEKLVQHLCLGVAGGEVVELAMADQLPEGAVRQVIKGTVTPGYLDLQVNGGGGVFINTLPTAAGMCAVAQAHRQYGTVAIMPTVITDAPEVLERAAAAAEELFGAPGILGLHIEGPHISQARRGTHAQQHVRPMEPATLRIVERLRAKGIPVMITVAPEAVGPQDIAALAATGAVVSLGHTDATADEARAAFAAGVNCFTHLFNAMSPMLNRAPGVTGACINSDICGGIICDGHHVSDEMVGLAIRARPVPDRLFLVSDAMPTVGGPDHFSLYGQDVHLVDGRLVNAEGSLAGAHVTMAESVARLINVVGIAPATALKMATTIPAKLLGATKRVGLIGQSLQDILILGSDWSVSGTCAD